MTITTRTSKGSALTYAEMDSNLSSLDSDRTSLDSDRTVLITAKNSYEIDQWRLNSTFSTNDATVTDWERVDDANFAKIGTGMSEASGIFTFPRTGLYLVTVHVNIRITGADSSAGIYLQVSPNDAAGYDNMALIYEGHPTDDGNTNQSGANSVLINVTDASTFKFLLRTVSLGDAELMGNTTYNRTSILFERKGDAQ